MLQINISLSRFLALILGQQIQIRKKIGLNFRVKSIFWNKKMKAKADSSRIGPIHNSVTSDFW